MVNATPSRHVSLRGSVLFVLSGLVGIASAQQYRASALVGGLPLGPLPAAQVSIGGVTGVASDSSGNIYLGSTLGCVLRLDKTGNLRRVAGTCGETDSDGNQAIATPMGTATGLALDASGNLFIVDSCLVRKLATDGTIRTIAGNAYCDSSPIEGGTATSSSLNEPSVVAVDSSGSVYVAEAGRVRKITATGTITTLAPVPGRPSALALDSSGSLYVASGAQIFKISSSGTVSAFAGSTSQSADSGDGGPAINATFLPIIGMAFDPGGNLIIGDGTIRSISTKGIIRTIASFECCRVGQIYNPWQYGTGQIAVDLSGNIYAGLIYGNLLRRITPAGAVSDAAGNNQGSFTGDGGPSASGVLSLAEDVAVDGAGNVFIADFGASRVRKIAVDGTITTVAGNGISGFSGDGGPATRAQLAGPTGLAVDRSGNLFISEYLNNRVRKVGLEGTITTVAGFSGCCALGDGGPATQAFIPLPHGIAVDAQENLYITEWPDSRIRKVTPDGIITTIAGTGTRGFSGDGGPATAAQLDSPWGIAIDVAGNLYIADNQNLRLRKISTDGTITSVTTSAPNLGNPEGITVDSAGNIFTSRGLKIAPDGKVTSISAVSAAGQQFYLGGSGVAADAAGNLFVVTGRAVLKLEPVAIPPPLPPIQGIVSAASGLQGTFAAGEIVVIYVSGFGPANVTTPPPGSTSVPTSLAGTRVFFNGIAAPILYTGSTQICAIVPYNFLFLVSPGNTNPTAPKTFPVAVQVVYGNLQTATLSVTITNASPGVFTLSQNGAGPAAALNQDGSINGRANPAAPGTTIVFFATGEGQTAPAGVDGKLAVAPYPQPLASVGVTIGGLPATVLYAGGAPGEVAGVMQVNAVVPPGLTANSAAALQLNIGSAVSQTGVTVAVSGN